MSAVNFSIKSLIQPDSQYAFFSAQACTLLFQIIVLAVIGWKLAYTDDITPEMLAYPKSRFFYMCCFDSVASILTFIATPGTPGSLTALLPQMIVPLNIVLSYCFLGARYSTKQLTGAALVVTGCGVAVWPLFFRGDAGSSSNLLSICLFALSRLPIAVDIALVPSTCITFFVG